MPQAAHRQFTEGRQVKDRSERKEMSRDGFKNVNRRRRSDVSLTIAHLTFKTLSVDGFRFK